MRAINAELVAALRGLLPLCDTGDFFSDDDRRELRTKARAALAAAEQESK